MVMGSFDVGFSSGGPATSVSGVSFCGVSVGAPVCVPRSFCFIERMSCWASSLAGSISSARMNSVIAPVMSP